MANNSRDYFCIFGGGGIRGVSYVGVMEALSECGINIKGCAGSSVGSIFAALIGVGYTKDELKEVFLNFSPEVFRDINFNFGKDFGLSKGDLYENWIRELIESKFYGEKYEKGKMKPVCFGDIDFDIIIPSVNLTDSTFFEFSRYKTPDIEIAQAVRASSSMPGLFKPVEIEGKVLIDGDIMKSWPLWRLSKNLCPKDLRVLEFRLEDCVFDKKIDNSIDYLNYVYNTATSFATDFVADLYGTKDKFDIIKLNTQNVSVVDFLISKEKKERIIEIGYQTTKNYFENILPQKKKSLLSEYTTIKKSALDFQNAFNKKDLGNADYFLGELFITLCEEKFNLDTEIKEKIINLKNVFKENLKSLNILFMKNKFIFKNRNLISAQTNELIEILNNKISELEDFIN